MKRAIIIAIIAVLVIAFVVYVIPGAAMWIAFSISGRGPKSPTVYENIGTKWVCEEPYIWFEVRADEVGNSGKGELETENGERIPVRFFMDRGTYYLYQESAFWEVIDDDQQLTVHPTEPCIMSGVYKMNKKGTKVTLSISEDEIYDYQYDTLTFYRQDPAGTEESAPQP